MKMDPSNYTVGLKNENNKEFERYIAKVEIINYFDLYFHIHKNSNWSNITSNAQLPPLTYLNIFNYHVNKKSFYTFEQFKCH